jgi:hypothetical protein
MSDEAQMPPETNEQNNSAEPVSPGESSVVSNNQQGGQVAHTITNYNLYGTAGPPISEVPEVGTAVSRLQELRRASLARSIERWQAAGVRLVQARELAEDVEVGKPTAKMLPTPEKPLLILAAELGAGKSLLGERIHQLDIQRSERDAFAPVPVYLRARDITGALDQAVNEAARGLGTPSQHGAAVVLDGADEIGVDKAVSLLSAARELAIRWPGSTVLITARDIPGYADAEEVVRVPPLSIYESFGIMRKIVGESPGELGVVHAAAFRIQESASLSDAIERPLFAVLAGVYLRDMPDGRILSRVELIEHLVERSLRGIGTGSERAGGLLERLAVLSTDRGGHPVPKHEVATGEELRALLETRLVVEHGGNLNFPLPMLAEWFASRALANNNPSPPELVADPGRLERWRFPLITYVGTNSYEVVSRLLDPLVRSNPGMASAVIAEGLSQWGITGEPSLPSALECGGQVRFAMMAWIAGLGPLARLIAPVPHPSDKLVVAVAAHSGGRLQIGWFSLQRSSLDVFELTPALLARINGSRAGGVSPIPGLMAYQSDIPTNVPAWAWKWTLDKLNKNLWDHYLNYYDLPMLNGPLVHESVWRTALTLLDNRQRIYKERRENPDGTYSEVTVHDGSGSMDHSPIPLDQLEHVLQSHPGPIYERQPSGYAFERPRDRIFDLDQLRTFIAGLRAAGETELKAPWPIADKEYFEGLSKDWQLFSPDQILARVRAVYQGALEGYQQLVNLWFPQLAPRLWHYNILPARLKGIVSIPQRSPEGWVGGIDEPELALYFEPLPHGSESVIDFRIGDRSEYHLPGWDDVVFEEMHRKVAQFRPHAANWLHAYLSTGSLDLFYWGDRPKQAAAAIAYGWLASDLKAIGWEP